MTRVYHPWWNWECYKAGFFNTTISVDDDVALKMYAEFLRHSVAFSKGMERVMSEWPNSCEQFLTNPSMNRIAWLGQSSMCITTGIPSKYRAGFKLLSETEQKVANSLAGEYLIKWENSRNADTKAN